MNQNERDELYEKIKEYDRLNENIENLSRQLEIVEKNSIEYIQLLNKGIIYEASHVPVDMFDEIREFIITKYKLELIKLEDEMRKL